MSHRLEVAVPDEVSEPLLKRADQEGRTPEEVVIDCLANSLAGADQPLDEDALLQLAGRVDSEVTGAGERHDYYLGQQLRKELGPRNHE